MDSKMDNLINKFRNPDYYELALIHKSFPFKSTKLDAMGHNERLEFLGDSVLGCLVAEELSKRFPNSDEGILSQMRSSLVSETALAALAKELGLHDELKMSFQEEKNGGREKSRILASAFEAVIGAFYLDSGFEKTKALVLSFYESHWPQSEERKTWDKDFKTQLQEISQKESKEIPVYLLRDVLGPDHEKIFKIEVEVLSKSFVASANSKKQAEQLAAKKALKFFNTNFKEE